MVHRHSFSTSFSSSGGLVSSSWAHAIVYVALTTLLFVSGTLTANLVVDTPVDVTTCNAVELSWSGGTGPYIPSISCSNVNVLGKISQLDAGGRVWVPATVYAGCSTQLIIVDADGDRGLSSNFTIVKSPGTPCSDDVSVGVTPPASVVGSSTASAATNSARRSSAVGSSSGSNAKTDTTSSTAGAVKAKSSSNANTSSSSSSRSSVQSLVGSSAGATKTSNGPAPTRATSHPRKKNNAGVDPFVQPTSTSGPQPGLDAITPPKEPQMRELSEAQDAASVASARHLSTMKRAANEVRLEWRPTEGEVRSRPLPALPPPDGSVPASTSSASAGTASAADPSTSRPSLPVTPLESAAQRRASRARVPVHEQDGGVRLAGGPPTSFVDPLEDDDDARTQYSTLPPPYSANFD
ncbi:hypothetical protein EIP86_005337 [Pleurotus ostreatoroseus]|nr:hypothetical protein EIP86_005337 [Pleurotus ostreatoroseus]